VIDFCSCMSNGFSIRSLGRAPTSSGTFNPFPSKKGPGRMRRFIARSVGGIAMILLWIKKKKNELGFWRFSVRAGGILVLLIALYVGILYLTLPSISDPGALFAAQSSVITDRNGVELYRLFNEEDRTYIPGEQIPETAKQAMIAIEDARYYQHGCIDLRAISRAALSQLLPRFFVRSGGSTLTQQLARNALLTREQTPTRKIKEMMLACKLERAYDKESLLELYLNWIPFGQNAYGIEQASQKYFGVHAKDLTLAQSAVLAALPQRPSYFNPFGKHVRTAIDPEVLDAIARGEITTAEEISESALTIGLLGTTVGSGSTAIHLGGRAEQVLRNMEDQGFITPAEHLSALAALEALTFKPARETIRAPHFVLWIREQVESMLQGGAEKGLLEQGGLTIETTLDWDMQQAAETIVAAKRTGLANVYGAQNVALLAAKPTTGEILAYVGNTAYGESGSGNKVDMVQAPRQPGSSFKPIVYTAAFRAGYGPGTVLFDVPTKFGDDEPQNYEGNFWGLMTARRALASSRNIPAIKAFFLGGGEDPVLELASKMGISTPLIRRGELVRERGSFAYGWPLAIGAAETPLLEMVQGYGTIANGGHLQKLIGIRSIKSKDGAILYSSETRKEEETEPVIDPRIAYEITSVLSDVSARPSGYWQQILSVPGYQAAAKTGTSNKCLERELPKGAPTLETQNPVWGKCRVRKPDNAWTLGFTPEIVAGVWVGNADSKAMSDKSDGLTIAAPIWQEFMVRAHKTLENPVKTFSVPEGLVQPQISLLSGELPTDCTPVAFRAPELFLSDRAPLLSDPACVKLKVDKVTGLLASPSCPEEAAEEQSFFDPHSILANRWPLWEKGVQEWATKEMEKWIAAPDHSGSLLPLPLRPTEVCDISKTPGRLVKPTLIMHSPTNGGSASYPSFQPDFDFTVGSSSGMTMTFTLDGKILAKETSAPWKPILKVPTSVSKDGVHTLEITLTDGYFNTTKEALSIRFDEDRNGPEVALLSPIGGTVIKTTDILNARANAIDREGGIKYIEFFLNETLLARDPRDPYEVSYPLKQTTPGQHRLWVKATDLAGNTAEDSTEITVE
jgi:membrane peptidoglycan carboxypeptidase